MIATAASALRSFSLHTRDEPRSSHVDRLSRSYDDCGRARRQRLPASPAARARARRYYAHKWSRTPSRVLLLRGAVAARCSDVDIASGRASAFELFATQARRRRLMMPFFRCHPLC